LAIINFAIIVMDFPIDTAVLVYTYIPEQWASGFGGPEW